MSFHLLFVFTAGVVVLGLVVRIFAVAYIRLIGKNLIFSKSEVSVFYFLPPASVSSAIFRNGPQLPGFVIFLGLLSFFFDYIAPLLIILFAILLVSKL
ncbi:MAG: hypothetical protein R3F04_00185 [Lysobacteraceae bacterium]